MRRAFGFVLCTVLAFSACPASMAQEPAANPGWETCLQAPTRACILDEALVHALAIEPSEKDLDGTFVRTTQLVKIAETQAAAGNVQTALRIAQLIPSDQASRVTALRSIAAAQAGRGMASEAKETFTQARQFADALADQLSHAEVLHSLAQGEAEAGMAAEATNTFEESLKLAESVAATPAVLANSPCVNNPAGAESRLDSLLKSLAEQQARAGSLSNALGAVRSIVYEPSVRAKALQAIAEIQAQRGQKDAAGQVLKEALVWFQVPPPERWPSCPNVRHLPPSGDLDALTIGSIATTQAKAGLTDEAAAMFGKALQLIPKIKDPAYLKAAGDSVAIGFLKADVSKVSALSAVARAQHEAGFEAQSAATFEQAMQAAMTLGEPIHRAVKLSELGHEQHQIGRDAQATRALDSALEAARAVNGAPRAYYLLTVLAARIEAGLMADADTTLAQTMAGVSQSITEGWRRVPLLRLIAEVQEEMGRREDAVATYREALAAADAAGDTLMRSNALAQLIYGFPGPSHARLIAESAPQAARIAQSMAGELRRASALIAIASALPN